MKRFAIALAALVLAGLAIARGIAWRDRRARMALAFGVAGVLLSFGAAMPGYATLSDYVCHLTHSRSSEVER